MTDQSTLDIDFYLSQGLTLEEILRTRQDQKRAALTDHLRISGTSEPGRGQRIEQLEADMERYDAEIEQLEKAIAERDKSAKK